MPLLDCNTAKKNIGLTNCNRLPAMLRGMITTPEDFKLTPTNLASDSAAKTALQNAILNPLASRIFLWPFFVAYENISEEAVFEDNPLAYMHVRDGNYRFRFMAKESLYLHKNMYTHRANSGRAYLFDIENQLIGTKDADGNFYGLKINTLATEKFQFSDGSNTTKSPIVLALANNLELDLDGGIIQAGFVNTLERLVSVKITIVSATSTTIKAKVAVEGDDTPVNGLALADFVLTTTAGAAQTITGMTEVNGEYTLTGTAFVDGFLDLKDPNVLSIQAYEAVAPATVDVV